MSQNGLRFTLDVDGLSRRQPLSSASPLVVSTVQQVQAGIRMKD